MSGRGRKSEYLHLKPALPMNLTVELSTPLGLVFRGETSSVEMRTGDGSVLVLPPGETIISMIASSTITLRQQTEFRSFHLKNASVGLRGNRLTILAEVIEPAGAPVPRES